LSHELLGDLASALKDPLAAFDRYKLAAEIMEGLISSAPANAGWRDSLAFIYTKVAAIQKCRGEMDGALFSYGQALSIRSKLLAENPDDFGTIMRVARSEKLVAEVLELRAEPERALTHYRRVIELATRMIDMHRDEAAVRDLLLVVQRRVDLLAGGGRSDESLRACPSA
jgi:tetratricopeptide (TPR) repeat protein